MGTPLIVHLATFLQGGAGRTIAALACAQQRRGNDVMVVTSPTAEPGFGNYEEAIDAIRASGARLLLVDSLFKRDQQLNDQALTAIIKELGPRRPDVVHAHAAVPARIGLSLGSPVVQTMHGWSLNKSVAHTEDDLAIMRRVDAVVFPSEASRQELLNIGAQFQYSTIVPNGIAADVRTEALPEPLRDLPQKRAQGTKVLASIGSVTKQKNQAIVIEALPAIARNHHVIAVFVGEGPDIPRLTERANELGVGNRIRFCGYIQNAASVLQEADLLIQPSLTESFGIAVIEAFRARVPVVASAIPALNELVGDTGCGIMFDATSPESLTAAIDQSLTRSAADTIAVIDRARRLFDGQFTLDRMIEGYDSLYRSVAR